MVRLTINKNNQATITIPKDVIEATGWKNGDIFYIGKKENQKTAYIEKIEEEEK